MIFAIFAIYTDYINMKAPLPPSFLIASLFCLLISCSRNITKLEPADNIVVAHRGGSLECGQPDNSIAALDYAISLGCMASECDVYWTKDNHVIVAHADIDMKINGLYPWQHTLEEIRSAGKLPNGEDIPILEEYLEYLMKNSRCTELWIDIKAIYYQKAMFYEPSFKASVRSCEIIDKMKANEYVKFICSSHKPIMEACCAAAETVGVPVGWMANAPVEEYVDNAYDWANLGFYHMKDGFDALRISSFLDAGIRFSVYTVDNDGLMDTYAGYSDKLYGITTNYPKKLIEKLR